MRILTSLIGSTIGYLLAMGIIKLYERKKVNRFIAKINSEELTEEILKKLDSGDI